MVETSAETKQTPASDPGSDTSTPCPWGGGFRVRVQPSYNHLHSRPDDNAFVFVYRVTITNESARPATLVSRHWKIIDADGTQRDVEGEGVVGAQPTIEPGESYEYASFCPLETAWGTMEGEFTLIAEGEGVQEIRIGRFYLVPPGADDSAHEAVDIEVRAAKGVTDD